MQSAAPTVEKYLEQVPEERKAALKKLRDTLVKNIPKGFEETMGYGMAGFVVPHSIYPAGYHCNPKQPLPFISFASQKNFIAFYHMGMYAMPDLLEWFTNEFPKHSKKKLDMGKSCVRFKKPEDIPFELLGELAKKVSVKKWVEVYESNLKTKQ
jgi:uncharacterized protein YdhG (YjbR/CyaY superfamily)